MRKVHLISISEPLLSDLASAIHEEGYEVTVSGDKVTEELAAKLSALDFRFPGSGWFPERLTKDIEFVVIGNEVKPDNPELLRAKELNLLIMSIPEFVFLRSKSKTRIVIVGSYGKEEVLSLIIYALQKQKFAFDYALTSKIDLLSGHFSSSYEARISLIEGNEHLNSTLEKRYQLEFYRPHIAVITGLEWRQATDHVTPETYFKMYNDFISSIEREGKLVYCSDDAGLVELADEAREDITAIPYTAHPFIEKEGKTFLTTHYGEIPVRIPNPFFLTNLNAARIVCRQLGVKDADFYQSVSAYSQSL
ncbi:UDP-N-acetylmuramate--alanine ligase [Parabacteroides sp. Marseille-P3160]|uniref:UDP-N-acetylmuramate--alanine ligase n=1 Tax=Parabacteroides sp. Marseille-P3160 TaxID=1917887 RepID=UPI0009BBC02E|nr:UDP-N-acetylmuramate--alanine ligase [Parabacteroides sp. Marseille-P3160]